ncbi:hypothetical protein T31B1_08093 [Salinisphaera sp. T31B1]
MLSRSVLELEPLLELELLELDLSELLALLSWARTRPEPISVVTASVAVAIRTALLVGVNLTTFLLRLVICKAKRRIQKH